MRACLLTTALLSTATPALAEVCDKERPDWVGPPVTIWQELWAFLHMPMALGVIYASVGLTLCAAFAGRRRLNWLAATPPALFALGMTADWLALDQITAAAIREGCIGAPLLSLALLTAISAVNVYLALRPSRMAPI